ncbi:hypothetical protein [Pseudosporangium ferrugineum]|uniref:Uncharacterized protein n=1 Tax=Pseudosporangium ferrugineum TaxID=439699 RepID=A0A2T0RS44_9ACTN|nr:hypothetical protein [Pseudosporangium ferrugineum]PRY24025.1 hypothetical protein CLV70_114158 [Pseudosporangium ferrugineum]
MTDYQPITGMPCDATHPFPAPHGADWIDSMEYGEDQRLQSGSRLAMHDRDSTPIWRAIAANMWGTDCYGEHLAAVAADPILAAHTIAIAAVAYPPENTDMITRLGFDQSGAGQVFAALRQEGQEAGRTIVDAMPLDLRKSALAECVAHINHGFTAMRLDIGARFPG